MSEVKERIHDIGKEVEMTLRDYPMTRENDTLLIWTVWRNFHDVRETITFDMMNNDLPSFETIRRTRQKIQNDLGKYLPHDPVVRKRRGLEAEWKDALQYEMFE